MLPLQASRRAHAASSLNSCRGRGVPELRASAFRKSAQARVPLLAGYVQYPHSKVTRMIRILTTEEPAATTITIEGHLVAEYVDEVKTSVRLAMEKQKKTRLFLRNVVHMDDAGRSLLACLAAQGVELGASGIYSTYVIRQIVA